MENKMQDYLPLYVGCDCQVEQTGTVIKGKVTGFNFYELNNVVWVGNTGYPFKFFNLKLFLRPLKNMTNEEAIKVAALAFDVDKHNYPLTDFHVRKPEKGTTIIVNIDNDWFDEMLRIGIETGNVYNERNRIYNQAQIYQFLLSRHFDLFGLIDAGLAIQIAQSAQTEASAKIFKNGTNAQ